jgi:hypothetical protein
LEAVHASGFQMASHARDLPGRRSGTGPIQDSVQKRYRLITFISRKTIKKLSRKASIASDERIRSPKNNPADQFCRQWFQTVQATSILVSSARAFSR